MIIHIIFTLIIAIIQFIFKSDMLFIMSLIMALCYYIMKVPSIVPALPIMIIHGFILGGTVLYYVLLKKQFDVQLLVAVLTVILQDLVYFINTKFRVKKKVERRISNEREYHKDNTNKPHIRKQR